MEKKNRPSSWRHAHQQNSHKMKIKFNYESSFKPNLQAKLGAFSLDARRDADFKFFVTKDQRNTQNGGKKEERDKTEEKREVDWKKIPSAAPQKNQTKEQRNSGKESRRETRCYWSSPPMMEGGVIEPENEEKSEGQEEGMGHESLQGPCYSPPAAHRSFPVDPTRPQGLAFSLSWLFAALRRFWRYYFSTAVSRESPPGFPASLSRAHRKRTETFFLVPLSLNDLPFTLPQALCSLPFSLDCFSPGSFPSYSFCFTRAQGGPHELTKTPTVPTNPASLLPYMPANHFNDNRREQESIIYKLGLSIDTWHVTYILRPFLQLAKISNSRKKYNNVIFRLQTCVAGGGP